MTLAALMLTGCATGPKVYTNVSPGIDLTRYQTFGFSRQLGTDRAAGQRSILSNHLIQATRREMETLGYRYSESNPDLEVNFYLQTAEKVQATSTPATSMGMGYYGYRRGFYSAWGGYDTTVTQYTEGTLHVDLVDNALDELVWEGIAVGRLTDKVRENLASSTATVIADIFQRHPLATSG